MRLTHPRRASAVDTDRVLAVILADALNALNQAGWASVAANLLNEANVNWGTTP